MIKAVAVQVRTIPDLVTVQEFAQAAKLQSKVVKVKGQTVCILTGRSQSALQIIAAQSPSTTRVYR